MEIAAENSEGQPFLTGYFRDGKRRIDLILVSKHTKETAIEKLKIDFLTNTVNMGFDLEIEAGTDDTVADLNFIKIHAPDSVLKRFGYFFNTRKYFKKSHVEFINNNVKDEKELIKLVRRWYPGPGNYSTIERATIVYKALLSCPFGKPLNFVGINQLLDRKIFLDMYPLHDGPYQLVVGQLPLELNGRQAVYSTWCGLMNIFNSTPVHLLREYFGERIAFLFSFYQFYNTWLYLFVLPSAVLFGTNYLHKKPYRLIQINEHNENNTFTYFNGTLTYNFVDLPVCPKCNNLDYCPIRMLNTYERELKIKIFLANPFNFFLAYFVPIWSILLYIFWKRREHYLYWMWECNEKDANFQTRPEYRISQKPLDAPQKVSVVSKTDKIIFLARQATPSTSFIRNMMNYIKFLFMTLALVIICGYFLCMCRLKSFLWEKKQMFETKKIITKFFEQYDYLALEVLGVVHAVCIMVMEYLWYKVSSCMAKFENVPTEWNYERTHFVNLFGVSLLINITMLLYYAFWKGLRYMSPFKSWDRPEYMCEHCGVLTCIDEAFILFAATFKTKICIQDSYRFLKANLKWLRPDDRLRRAGWSSYAMMGRWPQVRVTNKPVERHPPPCWEREFRLRPTGDNYFKRTINRILLQYAIVTMFMTCFNTGPIFASLWNSFHHNYMANSLVRSHRRPMLVQSWGLGGWNQILMVMPFITCFFNALFIAKHNTLLHIKFNKKHWSNQTKRRFIADYHMSLFNATDASNSTKPKMPYVCMFPGQVRRLVTFEHEKGNSRFVHNRSYKAMSGYYYIWWCQALIALLLMVMYPQHLYF